MNKIFKCPHCNKKNNLIGSQQQIMKFQKYDINTEEYQTYDEAPSNSTYYCLDCNKDIKNKELTKQNISL